MATQKPSLLTTLAEQRAGLGHRLLSKDAVSWMQEKIKEIRKPVQVANAIAKEKDRRTNTVRLGMMYCYYYDAKTKDDLPYWDRFPVILVLEKYEDGFLGLNLHYLPFKYRVAFLRKLTRFAQYNDKDEIYRIQIGRAHV